MSRKRSTTLTEGEQRIMEVLWKLGNASVAQVLDALPKSERPAFNSVQTMLRIMEQKGYVRHVEAGRAFVYHPVVARVDAARAAVRNVIKRFFDNSAEQLTVRLLEDESLSETELKRLRKLIADSAP
jgi:predicted transcriptional regulator